MCEFCDGPTDTAYWDRVQDLIQANGWTVQYVMGEDDRNPAFAYTIGLSRCTHPEIIVFICHPECAMRALEPLARAVLDGRRFDEGDDLSGLYPYSEKAELLRFPDSSSHLFMANSMYRAPGEPPIPALQLYWPTREPLLAGGR
jgi:hypothetical protein